MDKNLNNLDSIRSKKKSILKSDRLSRKVVPHGKIVWGVDLEGAEFNRLKVMRDTLVAWNQNADFEVLPVSVFAQPHYYGTLNLLSSMRGDLLSYAIGAVKPKLEGLRFDHLKDLKVIQEKSGLRGSSLSKNVKSLLNYAISEKSEFIAVNTHARRGLEHFWVGSFTETLIGSSPIPVLTINPHTVAPKEIATILCPVNFTVASRHAFERAMAWAQGHSARLVLFHQIEIPFGPGYYGDYGTMIDEKTMDAIRRGAEEHAQHTMRRWVQEAQKIGLRCEGRVEFEPEDIAKGILRCLESENADMVVVTTNLGPLGQKIIGSVAREVLISASRPVVVVHEEEEEEVNQ